MAKTAILAIRIISDATKAAKGFQQAETSADRFGRRAGKAASVATVGLAGLGVASFKAAKAAASDEASQAKLANALRKNTGARKADIAGVEQWIDAQSRAKGVADDEMRPALAALARASGSVSKAQKDLKLAMDVSAATGKPLEAVSNALAKGYSGNTAALGKLVPGLDAAVLKSKDMGKITDELNKKVGGDAIKAAQTSEGQTRRMTIAWGELQEKLGAFLLPILLMLSTVLTSVAAFIDRNSQAVAIAAAVFASFAAVVISINAAFKAYQAVAKAAAAVQAVFNAVMSANPVAIVVLAIIALAAGFVVAYKRSETFRGIVQAVGRAGQTALNWIVDKAQAVANWFGKLGPAASKGKELVVTAFDAYTTPIQVVIDLVQKLIGWIKNIKWPKPPKWLGKVTGLVGLGGAPAAHSPGGSVPAAGRGGPTGGGMTLGVGGSYGGGAVVINFHDFVLDENAVVKKLEGMFARRNVRLGRPA
jgi:uncharacterized membrane protein YgcG